MKLSLMLHAAAFLKKKHKNHGKGMAGGCLQNLSVPHAAFVGKLSFPFSPTHKSNLFSISICKYTTHSGEGLGDPACVPWVSSARDVQPEDAVGVCETWRKCWGHPSLAWARLCILGGVWCGPGAPGVVLGRDPRPGLCIDRESLNASRAGMDWKTSSLAGGSTGHLQVPWQGRHGWGHPCARARHPLAAASTSPGAVSRQMLPWSSTSNPLLTAPFFLLFLFPNFPPHRASILETNFKNFFFF